MTMPHLENCPHSTDGWCLGCVKELLDEQVDIFDTLLSDIGFFETTADAGPGREVEDVSVKFWHDGSGALLVKIAAKTEDPGFERMLNRIFYTEVKLPFDDMRGLYEILKNMDSLKSKHPESK